MGVQIPFLPVWLGARGLGDHEIAFILSAPQFLRVVATPLFAQWADRRGDFVGLLVASLVVMTGLGALLGFLSGFAPIFVAVTLFTCAQGVSMPLNDALTLRRCCARRIRLCEAPRRRRTARRPPASNMAAFANGARPPISGRESRRRPCFLSFLTAVSIIPYSALPAIGSAWRSAPRFTPRPSASWLHVGYAAGVRARPNGRGLGLLIPVIGAAALIQSSHSLVNTFGSLHWAREGYSSAFIGAAWALGVVGETTFFALAGRWIAGPQRAIGLLALGGLTALLRWLVMTSDPGAFLLALAQAGHGFSFAATHMGSMLLIFELAPHAMRARAQGWLTAAIAGASAVVVALCGPLYGELGEAAYLVMAAIAAAGVVLALFVSLRLRRA